MYFLYSLALTLLFVALLPYFLYQAVRRGKYSGSFKQRMGLLPKSAASDGRKTVWVHTVSVGEFLAARPLIERLRSVLPGARIVVSTTTLTGQRLAQSQSILFDASFYFPFDWAFAVRRAIACVQPAAVIILETELWPNFLRECRRRGVVTVLANGRISQRSFSRYRHALRLISQVMGDFSVMVMQSQADADRARQLGAPAHMVRVCGNLKYDQSGIGDGGLEAVGNADGATNPHRAVVQCDEEIDRQFALSASPHLIVAGSTAPDEEGMLLAALKQVRNYGGLEGSRLLVAPRHPERFNEVASLIARSGFTFARRSMLKLEAPVEAIATRTETSQTAFVGNDSTETRSADVILLDTIGELASIYRFADVVFVGGSLVRRGGHNIIEPAAFARPIIVGPHTENFSEIVSEFAREDALVQIGAAENASSALAVELIRLLSNRERARALGERARNILLRNRGATDCTVAAIEEVVKRDCGVEGQRSRGAEE